LEFVQLLDLLGKVVMRKELNTAAASLDIQNLPSRHIFFVAILNRAKALEEAC